MTLDCAKQCNLLQVIDSRFRGVAAGVGAARIVGRVHMAQLRFGKRMACDVSITVLEQSAGSGPELLLGLGARRLNFLCGLLCTREALAAGRGALEMPRSHTRLTFAWCGSSLPQSCPPVL